MAARAGQPLQALQLFGVGLLSGDQFLESACRLHVECDGPVLTHCGQEQATRGELYDPDLVSVVGQHLALVLGHLDLLADMVL